MPKFQHVLLASFALLFVLLGVSAITSSSRNTEAQLSINPSALTGEYDPSDIIGEFHTQQIASVQTNSTIVSQQVLGETNETKRIEVDLSAQRLYGFEGDRKVFDFLISSGKWNRTPTGTFHIWGKFRYTKMEGGSKEHHTYYYLPNVPFVMFFSNEELSASKGFSIHGTYWHDNFGHPMSHGCINMKTSEVEQIYNWAMPDLGGKRSIHASEENPGTEVYIYGEAPTE